MSARLAVTCNGPDCQASIVLTPDGDEHTIELPAEGWLRVHVDDNPDQRGHLIADYCGWQCYAADVVRHVMDGGAR